MSFEATKGLFKFDFTDQHAILGVPLDAEFNDMRKRYMKIVRRLHSDTCPFEDPADKDWANQFLSKVVNPAYNKFSKESDRKEYSLLLTAIVKRVAKEQPKIQVESDAAKQLASAQDLQTAYTTAVNKLADKQYESAQQALEAIGQISELNMVYLLRKERSGGPISIHQPATTTPTTTTTTTTTTTATQQRSTTPTPVVPPTPKIIVPRTEECSRRAQGFMNSKNYAKAILELKEALKHEPKNSKAHGMLAMCYFQQGQATMAKLEVQKALASDPQEPTALEVKKKLEQPAATKGKKEEKPGGFFGGLFGGGKKK